MILIAITSKAKKGVGVSHYTDVGKKSANAKKDQLCTHELMLGFMKNVNSGFSEILYLTL